MQLTKLSDKQCATVFHFGKKIHDQFLNDTNAKPEDVEAWIKKVYRYAGRPKPIIKIASNPYQFSTFRNDPDILKRSLQVVADERGKYISGKYSWKIRVWMYRTVFDQRLKGLFTAIENDLRANQLADQRIVPSSFTVVDKAANLVAEAYRKIDSSFPISEFYCVVCSFTKLDLYGLRTGENECWVLKLPVKAQMHPVEGVPHADNTPAIVWRDGTHGYFLHGTRFPKAIWEGIVQGKITISEIEGWQNLEQVRAALRYLGPQALLNQCQTQLIDCTAKGNRLYNVKSVASLRDVKILTYKCPSSGKVYQKFVCDSIYDADYAQAWRYKLRKKEYLMLNES